MRIIVKKSWLSLLITVYCCATFHAHAQSLIVIDEQKVEQDTILFKCKEGTVFSIACNTEDPIINQLQVLKASVSNNYRQDIWDFSSSSDLPACSKEGLDLLFSLVDIYATKSSNFITFDFAAALYAKDNDKSYEILELFFDKPVDLLVETLCVARCLGASIKVETALVQNIVHLLVSSKKHLIKNFMGNKKLCKLLWNLPEDLQSIIKRELFLELKEWYVVLISMLESMSCLKEVDFVSKKDNNIYAKSLVSYTFKYEKILDDYHYYPCFGKKDFYDKWVIKSPYLLLANPGFRNYKNSSKKSYLFLKNPNNNDTYYPLHTIINKFTLPQILYLISFKYKATQAQYAYFPKELNLLMWDELYSSYHPLVRKKLNKMKKDYRSESAYGEIVKLGISASFFALFSVVLGRAEALNSNNSHASTPFKS